MAFIGEGALGIIKENVRQALLTREAELWTLGTSWHRISLDDGGWPQIEECAAPDYACGGVDTAEPTLAHYMETMGFTVETTHRIAYGITRETVEPDLMAATRDIARGS